MPVTSQNLFYKSYRGVRFSNGAPGNGSEPSYLTVKVFATKKPKVEVSVGTGWFSESRGFGGVSEKKVTFTDTEMVAFVRGLIVNPAGIGPFIDFVSEKYPEVKLGYALLSERLQRWWLLSRQENVSAFLDQERRDRAFADKKFYVGQAVTYRSRHGGPERGPFVIYAERFDWHPYLGGGWRFAVPGIDAPQSDLIPFETPVVETCS